MRPQISRALRLQMLLLLAAAAVLASCLALSAFGPVARKGAGFSLAATLGATSLTFEVAADRIDLSLRTEAP